MNPRTAIRDAILAAASEGLAEDEVRALEDVGLSATEAAIRNRATGLVDFEAYPLAGSEVAL